MKVIACGAPYGSGGLGRHLTQVIEEARAAGELARYYATSAPPDDDEGSEIDMRRLLSTIQRTPLRYDAGWRNYALAAAFDWSVSSRLVQLPSPQWKGEPKTFVGFAGQALQSFKRARSMGYHTLQLEAANSHIDNVLRQHARAARLCGVAERSWLNAAQAARVRREYAKADVIYAASEYTAQTLIDGGVPAHKLARRRLMPDARFAPPSRRVDDGVFRIVYVGSISAMKGIPILIDAFGKLDFGHWRHAELTLVGGWASRAMRVYMESKMAADPRIKVMPGDPLPHLQRANVYVHPTFEDGFAYAPMEALACGLPVIVTEDTGMKEHVREGVNGYIVPTGDRDALVDRLVHVESRSSRAVAVGS